MSSGSNIDGSNVSPLGRIELKIAPAMETLEEMLHTGQEETFDFAFIDADKGNYVNYYNLCLKLVRKGGIVALDNTLFKGKVLHPNCENKTVDAIKRVNQFIKNDVKVDVLLLNIGDGLTITIKK